jgi:aminoglycoside phosphotransferase (APT) family kinase protein
MPCLSSADECGRSRLEAARVRLDRLAADLPVRLPAEPRFCYGASNDVWDLGDSFLRICWRADRDRVVREVRLLGVLPSGVPHAPVRASGCSDEVSWVLSERVIGVPLSDALRELSPEVLRKIFAQIAEILATLHDWRPPSSLRSLLGERPTLDPTSQLSVFGADLLPLPVARVPALAHLAKNLPYVDSRLVDGIAERILSLADVDPMSADSNDHVVVHGDPKPGNWLVHQGRITALLDFEWVRVGPRDLELVVPIFTFQRQAGDEPGPPSPPYLSWLAEDYPRMFAIPDLDRRLWLYELCFWLRRIVWQPSSPGSALRTDHELGLMRQLLHAPLPYQNPSAPP